MLGFLADTCQHTEEEAEIAISDILHAAFAHHKTTMRLGLLFIISFMVIYLWLVINVFEATTYILTVLLAVAPLSTLVRSFRGIRRVKARRLNETVVL